MRRSRSESSTPRWRQEFNREFRKHAIKPFDAASITKYATDAKRWHCACPDYCMGRFRMCKHLVLLLARHRTSSTWDIADLRVAQRLTAPFVAIEYSHDGDLLRDAVHPRRTRSVHQQPQFQGQLADVPPTDPLQELDDGQVAGSETVLVEQTCACSALLSPSCAA